MPSQMLAITNNPRLRRNQIAELQARQALLPQIIANKQRAEDLARDEERFQVGVQQSNRQHQLAQNRFAFEQESFRKQREATEQARRSQMGLEAGKLGLTVTSRFGDKKLGNIFGGGGSGPSGGSGNFISNLNVGTLAGGGLAGFGVGQMLGKKSKGLKAAAGLGTGALLGGLAGGAPGSGFNLSSALSGGFGGLIGGLF